MLERNADFASFALTAARRAAAELLYLLLRRLILRRDVAQAEKYGVARVIHPGKSELLSGRFMLPRLDGEGEHALDIVRHASAP
jgi:hypothetical protein